jgi:hypothetical protein
MPSHVLEYDAAGKEVARRTVPPRLAVARSPAQALFGAATPVTEVAVLVGTIRQLRSENGSTVGRERSVLGEFLEMSAMYFIPEAVYCADTGSGFFLGFTALTLLAAVVCALACFLWARRYSFARAQCLGWSVCGLLFGPLGLLLMLALEEWPARIACPACRQPRRVDRDRCEHCGAAHALPARDGTEIFETPTATAGAALAGH